MPSSPLCESPGITPEGLFNRLSLQSKICKSGANGDRIDSAQGRSLYHESAELNFLKVVKR